MKTESTPPAALASLAAVTGVLFRHGPKGSREMLSCATRLDTGVWAGVQDRGVFPGRVYGEFCGTEVVVDLFLHVAEADGTVSEHPVRWAMRTPLAPIALLGVPGAGDDAPQHVPGAEMAWPPYQRIHRPSFEGLARHGAFVPRAERTFAGPVGAAPGSIYEPPMMQHYRCGSDDAHAKRTICASADMDYPSDLLVGGPVVDDAGRLVGVVVGVDPGPERAHVGMYVPADMLAPCVAMARAAVEARRRGDRISTGIERVEFRNTDVDWPEEEESPRRHLRRSDLLAKVVLSRGDWDRIVALAEEAGPLDDGREAVDRLKAATAD